MAPILDTNIRIFISYSHGGNGPKWKASLLSALHVFEKHSLVDVWEDGKIRVGSFWNDDIVQAMNSASLAIVLLTREALDSEFILNVEFPRLRERQCNDNLLVFPIVCEECNWRSHEWLYKTQIPNNSLPLSQLSTVDKDCVFRNLATEIAAQLSHFALSRLPKLEKPLSANRIYFETFPLTRPSGSHNEIIIGREQELALLDLALARTNIAIVSLVAWGGVGKSMLVRYWLQRLQQKQWLNIQRAYGWSFYSQGVSEDRQASEEPFLTHALKWFGVSCEPTLSLQDKGRLLAEAVIRERSLLFLDGIEPLQYPPGPMGGQIRSPGIQSLLRHIARNTTDGEHHTLCLITTRESLTDLADFECKSESRSGTLLRMNLDNLTEEAGAALLHNVGAKRAGAADIEPNDPELIAASREVNCHALTLNLLGRFLFRAHAGNIRCRDLVKFEEADKREQGGTAFKMLAVFEKWFDRSGGFYRQSLAVLRLLGLFDRPADFGCLSTLREPPIISGLTDPLFSNRFDVEGQPISTPVSNEEWEMATSFLADFGLINVQANYDKSELLLDCHPLIREYFIKSLITSNIESWRSANRRMYDYLVSNSEFYPEDLEGLQPLYRAIIHGCNASMQAKVFHEIYYDRISRKNQAYSTLQLGAMGSNLAAIACFYEHPWDRISSLLNESDQAWLFNEAAFHLFTLGRLIEGVNPMRSGLNIRLKEKSWESASQISCNLSELELALGRMGNAIEDAERSVIYADNSDSLIMKLVSRSYHASSMFQAGQKANSESRFNEIETQLILQDPKPELRSLLGFMHSDFLLNDLERAAWQLLLRLPLIETPSLEPCQIVSQRTIKSLKISKTNNRILDSALDLLTLGRATLYRAILKDSTFESCQTLILESLDKFHLAGQQKYIFTGLLTRAWLRFLSGQTIGSESAYNDLTEAWEIAERGPMKLHMVDVCLYRARLFFRQNKYPWKSPEEDLAKAEKLIDESGYHRRDEELADAKRVILGLS